MDTDDFCRLERERTQALVSRDLETIERLHAPDYELITPGGQVLARDRYLALIAEAPFYSAWTHGPMRVLAAPSMASIRYRAALSFPSGKTLDVWHTDIYQLTPGGWQAVWSQATQAPDAGGAPSLTASAALRL